MKAQLQRCFDVRILMVFCLATVLGVVSACVEFPTASPVETTGGRDERSPNIVVFLVDTLRADRLGVYGYADRPTSPELDELASEAVVFEQAYSSSPWTLPTVASLATSTHSCEHGVVDDRLRLPTAIATVAELLVQEGYQTYGLYGNAYAGPSFGLDRGFESYTFSRRNNAKKVAPVLDRAAADGRPFLLYIHNMEPHGGERFNGSAPPDYVPEVGPERRRELLDRFITYRKLTRFDFARKQPLGTTDNTAAQRRELDFMDAHFDEHDVLYDAAVRLADRRFGTVIDLLRERGLWEDTVVVFLSDHGEELGEHGGWQHDQSLYEELIHVPLMIKLPNGSNRGTRVEQVVTLLDIAPTMLALSGSDAPRPALRGRNLLALLTPAENQGSDDGPVIVAVRNNQKKYYKPWKEGRGDLNIAVRDGSLKAIANIEVGTIELYDLATDPDERDDLSVERREDADRLMAFVSSWLARCGAQEVGASQLDEETLDHLRALGYVD